MSRSDDILIKLKSKIEEFGGVGFVSQYPADDEYKTMDVPDLADEPYVTNRHFDLPQDKKRDGITPKKTKKESAVLEQGEKEGVPPEAAGAAAGEEAGAEAGAKAAGSEPMPDMGSADAMAGMPGAGEMGGDMSMGGFGQEEEPKTAGELGRIYELKKIYARLTSIESYLAHESDDILLKIRTTVSQSIELFEVVASNFDSYKENLDEIIVTFYKFIAEVYARVTDQFKKIKNEEK